jgi:hypothetical protein
MLILGRKYSNLQQIYAKTSNKYYLVNIVQISSCMEWDSKKIFFCVTVFKSEEMHWTKIVYLIFSTLFA